MFFTLFTDHEIYIDNCFTSYDLLAHMRSLDLRLTGTVRSNRTGKCPLREDKALKKETRGDMDYIFGDEERRFCS